MSTVVPHPYQVVAQRYTKGFRTDNTLGGIWTVEAIAHGVEFSVDVSEEQYSAPNVHALLIAKANEIAAIQSLPASQYPKPA